ncbi:hypothetical protein [Sulfurospirillum cavolei]|uniref:hypothetical protein n=1 Tax=Sulfurospirillum cavolei TaxID=366522 RepID=UPI000764C257|nr:hypothetical protein [Sulfurospirillum cavolei]
MKAKLITLGLTVMVASSSLYAFGGVQGWNCGNQQNRMPFSHPMSFNGNSMRDIMMTLSSMDLSKTQWSEIRKVMFEMRDQHFDASAEKASVEVIHKDGSFDKEHFIKNRTSLSKEMIDTQAKSIEKILSILTEAQRKSLAGKLAI